MSRPSTPRPGRRSPRLLAALALVVGLGACTQGRTIPDDYTDGTRREFVEACVETTTAEGADGRTFREDDAQAVCACAFEGIVEEIPFDEFKRINEEQEEEPSALPEEMLDIMADCVADEAAPA